MNLFYWQKIDQWQFQQSNDSINEHYKNHKNNYHGSIKDHTQVNIKFSDINKRWRMWKTLFSKPCYILFYMNNDIFLRIKVIRNQKFYSKFVLFVKFH
jgi:hypothetical protein